MVQISSPLISFLFSWGVHNNLQLYLFILILPFWVMFCWESSSILWGFLHFLLRRTTIRSSVKKSFVGWNLTVLNFYIFTCEYENWLGPPGDKFQLFGVSFDWKKIAINICVADVHDGMFAQKEFPPKSHLIFCGLNFDLHSSRDWAHKSKNRHL